MHLIARCLREPLVHFAVLGLAVFGVQQWVAPPPPTKQIVVSAAMRRGLRHEYLRRHGRLPTPAEERTLVARYVDNEIMVREALVLGLDRGDVIVRRRLVQKMEFLNQGLEPPPEPTAGELQAYLDAHAVRYTPAARVSLEHVFVNAKGDATGAAAVAADLQRRLAAGEDPAHLGDPFLRGREFRAQTEEELGGIFGPEFARAVMALPAGAWAGPIASSFGQHVVRVTEHRGGHRPSLDEVRREVRRDWRDEQAKATAKDALARLRARYDVRIEGEP